MSVPPFRARARAGRHEHGSTSVLGEADGVALVAAGRGGWAGVPIALRFMRQRDGRGGPSATIAPSRWRCQRVRQRGAARTAW